MFNSDILINSIILIWLIVLTIIDCKTFKKDNSKGIPAYLSSGLLLFVLLIKSYDPLSAVYFGIIGLISGLFIIDLNGFEGFADLKVLVALSIMMVNIYFVMVFIILTVLASVPLKSYFKKRGYKEMPYLLSYLFVYIGYLIGVCI